jgi:hypothetical protein
VNGSSFKHAKRQRRASRRHIGGCHGSKRSGGADPCGLAAFARHKPIALPVLRFLLMLAILLILPGCASSPTTHRPDTPKSSAKQPNGNPPRPINTPAGENLSLHVITAVLPVGAVPYDNMVLPIVSPDGRHIATQTGVAPTWSTILAEKNAPVPLATRVEIYELDRRDGIDERERRGARLVRSLDEPLLLGRSCDSDGFLVESQRDDGSRWIGKASWRSGEITWLVTGTDVNAFGSLGPAGRLAWSRRAVDSDHFELVVRSASDEWAASFPDEHWLMPTWSGRGDGIFALVLRDEFLDIVYAQASNPAALQQSRVRLPQGKDASVYAAYQTVNGQMVVADAPTPGREQLVFFHPAHHQAAIWRPLAGGGAGSAGGNGGGGSILLGQGTFAAMADEANFAIVSTPENVVRRNLTNPRARMDLVAGTHIPRPTHACTWPYLLLSPGEGQIKLTAMRLLPTEARR